MPEYKSKIDPSKSRFTSKLDAKKSFEKAVTETHEGALSQNEKAFFLGQKYFELVKSKTLPENKGPLEQSLEKEVIIDLINFATEVNNNGIANGYDPNEPGKITFLEGQGSTNLSLLMLKAILILRDRLTSAEFALEKLQTEVEKRSAKIESSPTP